MELKRVNRFLDIFCSVESEAAILKLLVIEVVTRATWHGNVP